MVKKPADYLLPQAFYINLWLKYLMCYEKTVFFVIITGKSQTSGFNILFNV